jgi:hypothetical protein
MSADQAEQGVQLNGMERAANVLSQNAHRTPAGIGALSSSSPSVSDGDAGVVTGVRRPDTVLPRLPTGAPTGLSPSHIITSRKLVR